MANIFTQTTSPPFLKQSVKEYFVSPMFLGEDIRGAVTVRTDIKGTERLNRISRPSMITKPKNAPGFNPDGAFQLTYQDITVKPMAIEFEQNAREFWGSIVEQLLSQGYKEDDIEQMKAPDVWNKIILPVIAQSGQQDLVRQMFFANPLKEVLVDGAPNGVIDQNYSGYTGLMSHFMYAIHGGVIPSKQHVVIASSASAVKQEAIQTYTAGTDTKIAVTINGVAYEEDFDTNANTTIAAWLVSHKAIIEARNGINAVVVTNPTGAQIKIVSKYKGGKFTFTAAVSGDGSFAASGVVAPVLYGPLAVNEADLTLNNMLDAVTPEMHEFPIMFMITTSMWRNLVRTYKARNTELGDTVLVSGAKVPAYEGVPIMIRPDWDLWIASAHAGLFPHRAVLTTQKNLIFATDGTSDSEMLETWYNQEAQMRRYRVQYKAQTAFLHKELMILAGFGD